MTRKGKRQIGRKIDWCIVGLQNHQQTTYWVCPVCLGILNESCHSHQNMATHGQNNSVRIRNQ